MHGRIDRRASFIRRRIDRLMHQVRALARHPAALPVAFACGILAERLLVPGKGSYGLLAALAGQVKTMQLASSFIGSPVRRPVR